MKERDEILTTEQNRDLFKKIVIGLDHNYDSATGYNNEFARGLLIPTPEYQETEKFGILFNQKGGSSWITRKIRDNNLKVEENNGKFEKAWGDAVNPHPVKNPTEYGGWVDIMNGKSEKDFILVTRNPMYKWLSGMWEEVNSSYTHNMITRGDLILKEVNFRHQKNLLQLDETIVKDLVHKWLIGTWDRWGTLSSAHAKLYNEAYYNLLTSNNINKKKLKIVNIDSIDGDLVNVFTEYFPNLEEKFSDRGEFSSHRPKHKTLLEIIWEICRKDVRMQEHISNTIIRDLYYFNKILNDFGEQFYKPKRNT